MNVLTDKRKQWASIGVDVTHNVDVNTHQNRIGVITWLQMDSFFLGEISLFMLRNKEINARKTIVSRNGLQRKRIE